MLAMRAEHERARQHSGLTMKDWDMGWEPESQRSARPRPRLERARLELPRGGKDIAAQIGAELRIVFAIPVVGAIAGIDELLTRIKIWGED
jgi:hypothetical protein